VAGTGGAGKASWHLAIKIVILSWKKIYNSKLVTENKKVEY
jgi:hypothetical protein